MNATATWELSWVQAISEALFVCLGIGTLQQPAGGLPMMSGLNACSTALSCHHAIERRRPHAAAIRAQGRSQTCQQTLAVIQLCKG